MPMDSVEFAKSMIHQAEEFGKYMDEHILSRWEPFRDPGQTVRLMETQAWREFYLGVPTVAREIDQLPDEDADIKILLARQLAEELLHWKVCAERAQELGGNGDLKSYRPSPEDLSMYQNTLLPEFWQIATSLHIFGETILIHTFRRMIEVVDDRSAMIIRDEMLVHEGTHVRNGRLMLERHATTDKIQDAVRKLGQTKCDTVRKAYPYALPAFKIE
ncbi:MAG: ferritin-like domain-containing protein [Candidatus Tectomicrobia bacterium]|nr:ferritin-like domain-containing protein [Candidatus Tectomicrobia bacterium]